MDREHQGEARQGGVTRRRLLQGLGLGAAGVLLPASVAWGMSGPARRGGPLHDQAGTAPEARARLFDPARAWDHLLRQVDAGPRVPGMPGHAAVREYLLRELEAVCDQVEAQDFTWDVRGTTLRLSNVIGVLGPERPEKVVLAAHWDTRPWADQDRNPANRQTPIPGANDGASGVAVLLEVARVLRQAAPPVGVVLVMFDGEDYGPDIDAMFLGSRYYARNLVPARPAWGILLDMVGDRDLQIPREGISQQYAPAVNDRVWAAARTLGRPEFADRVGPPVLDDHVPLLEVGVPMIDVIDFDYGPGHAWWHTLEDTPDKCSPASLEAVGQVVLATLYAAGG